jgi:hypothetical protein
MWDGQASICVTSRPAPTILWFDLVNAGFPARNAVTRMTASVSSTLATVCLTVALIAIPSGSRQDLHAQTSPRFDALVSLAEGRMKEYGVPGVALGIISGGDVSTEDSV